MISLTVVAVVMIGAALLVVATRQNVAAMLRELGR